MNTSAILSAKKTANLLFLLISIVMLITVALTYKANATDAAPKNFVDQGDKTTAAAATAPDETAASDCNHDCHPAATNKALHADTSSPVASKVTGNLEGKNKERDADKETK